MIATLTGIVTDKQDDHVVIDCGGVGYGVSITNHTAGTLNTGEKTKIYTYEYIKEESHDLYGFVSWPEKQFFEKLLSVNGVGPKMAISLMNLGTPEEVASAIGSENTAYIMRASGVGRRLAERIIVDLKATFADSALAARVSSNASDDALQALLSLGYSQQQALTVLADIDADNTEDQIKQALKALAG